MSLGWVLAWERLLLWVNLVLLSATKASQCYTAWPCIITLSSDSFHQSRVFCVLLQIAMETTRSFQAVLQNSVSPEQDAWTYTCLELPQPNQSNAAGLIKHIAIVSTEAKQEMVLRFGAPPDNRVTRAEPLDKLLLLSFVDFRLSWPAICPEEARKPASMKESGDYVTRMLKSGIELNGVRYHFFGHSNSQLKSRSCFMYAASKTDIASKIEAMGNFSSLKSVAKKAKRIGLLFSSAEVAMNLAPERCEDIEDVKRNNYLFTDGCGSISFQLARYLAQRRNIIVRDKRYLPSVYQIRYRGYKGVLTLDSTLKGQVQVQFRKSMRKFTEACDHSFAVVDYSRVSLPLRVCPTLTPNSRTVSEASTMRSWCFFMHWASRRKPF